MNISAEVVIVGGGIVGATAAALMAQYCHHVVLLEKHPPAVETTPLLRSRVSAITPVVAKIWRDLGIWEAIPDYCRTDYEQMVVWDKANTHEGKIIFDAASVGEKCLGTIVDNRCLLNALWDHLSHLSNVSLVTKDPCVTLTSQGDKQCITTQSGHKITAALVVGADGAHSWLREIAGFSLQATPYEHQAIVAVVATEHSHEQTAWQRFLPHGPLAFLPLSAPPEAATNYYSAIVWSTHPEEAEKLMALDEKAFCQACGEAFDFTLGKITHCEQRFMFPLIRRHVTQYVKPGMALVGDAAHTLHPLAGQGMNLGIYDVVALNKVVKKAHDNKRNFAAYHTLRAYERQRKTHNTVMLASMDAFKGLFGNSQPFVGELRRRGLNKVNQWPCIKRQLIHYAFG